VARRVGERQLNSRPASHTSPACLHVGLVPARREIQEIALVGVSRPLNSSELAARTTQLLDSCNIAEPPVRSSLPINLLAGATLLIPILVRVVFADTSVSAGWDNTANLVSDICVGYFAAWFVYYLVSWRPRRQDRDRALITVGNAALQVAGVANDLLRHLRAAAGNTETGPIDQRDLAEMVKGLNIYTAVPTMVGWDRQSLNVLAMFREEEQRSEDRAGQCTRLALFLDAELLAAIYAIQQCSFFAILRMLPPSATAELTVFVPQVYEYLVLCDGLRELRLITRRAYGFHSAQAALALVMLTCGPITLTPPHELNP
jgi:alkylhydroperoxidase/carboxymuconolactone decarboxylase family protein YurZ